MAVRYCKQSNDYACGPIAAGNALKFLGLINGFSKLRKLYIGLLGCDRRRGGTTPESFNKGIRRLHPDLVVIKRNSPSRKYFDTMLRDGYGAIVRFEWCEYEDICHYAFFEPRSKVDEKRKLYMTANFHGGGAARKYVDNDDMKNLFGKTHRELKVWFVRRRDT